VGQVPCISWAQAEQNVHSKLQMNAALSKVSAASQRSQRILISSAIGRSSPSSASRTVLSYQVSAASSRRATARRAAK
jgi:hypothetical protein